MDDHTVVRAALRMLIENQSGMVVVGEAANKAEAVPIAARELPDIILLDLCLGDESGVDLIPALLAASEESGIIILTGVHDPAEHQRAMRQGAMGVVHKEASAVMLIKAIHRVHAGELWLDRGMTAKLVSRMRRDLENPTPAAAVPASTPLTARELEVVSLVGEGLRNKQIADRLSISEATVRHHLTSILRKLEVSDRLELLIYAYQNNLVSIKPENGAGKTPPLPPLPGRTLQ